jgi:Tol biopolymer transport system component
VHCTAAVPAGDNLVIGTVVGDPTVVVRDIQDPAHARNLCAFDSTVLSPQFVSGTTVAYETGDNQIIEADLAGSATTLLATYSAAFDSGQYAFSPDGKSMTYLDTDGWHLLGQSGNRVLAHLPAAPGRGVSPNQDDSFLAFSPDGQYIAYFQTFHVGGTGATAADQIRKASDGSLVYSTSDATMAVWASVPSRLFFRTSAGAVKRWDPSAGVSSVTSEPWVRPKASPDGRWIAYTFPASGGVGAVGFFSVQANAVQHKLTAGRSGPRFLSNDLVWYIGERACTTCFGGQPQSTGVTYIYSIAGASEVTSRLASVSDAWPHVTAPAL